MRELELGLGDPPVRRFLFVGQDETDPLSCWYELNANTQPMSKVPVQARALTGFITGLALKEHTGRFGPKWKLTIFMDAGQPFAVRSGLDTVFSRGVILALCAIETPEQLGDALTIVVTPSKENVKIVFGAIYLARSGQRVKCEWSKDADLVPLIQHLQSILGDGGQTDDIEDDAGHNSDGNNQREQERTSKPSGLDLNIVRELKRVAVQVGYTIEGKDNEADMVKLNAECHRLYPSAKTIHDLTGGQAIEFRKTLLSA